MKTRLLSISVCFAMAVVSLEASWHQEPFRIKAGDATLDTAVVAADDDMDSRTRLSNSYGHAGPHLADVDGDGKRDLLVGTFSGRIRLHRNVGTDAAPAFDGTYSWIEAGKTLALVPIYCCIAPSPLLMDIDGDGIADLISGCYDPGAVYWFKGLGAGKFGERHMLTDTNGMPVLTRMDVAAREPIKSWCSVPALVDWNNDGKLDMIIGGGDGQLYLRLQSSHGIAGYTALPSQPVFVPHAKQTVIPVSLGKGTQNIHAAPSVVDWDGDGLFDIIVGTYGGAIYLLRNTGKLGEPKFEICEELLPRGIASNQRLVSGQEPERGIRAQVHAVDYNRDGKMDLVVGTWSNTTKVRADLRADEMARLIALEKERAELDALVGYDQSLPRTMHESYLNNQVMSKRIGVLEREITQFLEKNSLTGHSVSRHGHVWVYLGK